MEPNQINIWLASNPYTPQWTAASYTRSSPCRRFLARSLALQKSSTKLVWQTQYSFCLSWSTSQGQLSNSPSSSGTWESCSSSKTLLICWRVKYEELFWIVWIDMLTVVVKCTEILFDIVNLAFRFQKIQQFALCLLLNKHMPCVWDKWKCSIKIKLYNCLPLYV